MKMKRSPKRSRLGQWLIGLFLLLAAQLSSGTTTSARPSVARNPIDKISWSFMNTLLWTRSARVIDQPERVGSAHKSRAVTRDTRVVGLIAREPPVDS